MRHKAQFVSPDDLGPPLVAREFTCSAGGLDVQPEGPAGSVRSKSNRRPSSKKPPRRDRGPCPARSTRVTEARVAFTTACRANTSGIPTVAAISTWCQVDYAPLGGPRETIRRHIAIATTCYVQGSCDSDRRSTTRAVHSRHGSQSRRSCPHKPAKRKQLHEPAVLRPPFSGT